MENQLDDIKKHFSVVVALVINDRYIFFLEIQKLFHDF